MPIALGKMFLPLGTFCGQIFVIGEQRTVYGISLRWTCLDPDSYSNVIIVSLN